MTADKLWFIVLVAQVTCRLAGQLSFKICAVIIFSTEPLTLLFNVFFFQFKQHGLYTVFPLGKKYKRLSYFLHAIPLFPSLSFGPSPLSLCPSLPDEQGKASLIST